MQTLVLLIFNESVFLTVYYLQGSKNKTVDTILIKGGGGHDTPR